MFVAKSEKPNKYYKSNLKSSRSKKKKDWILPFFIVLFVIPITNKNWRKIKSPFVLDGVGLKLETSPRPVFCYFTYFGHSESNSWSKHYVLAPVLKGPPNSPLSLIKKYESLEAQSSYIQLTTAEDFDSIYEICTCTMASHIEFPLLFHFIHYIEIGGLQTCIFLGFHEAWITVNSSGPTNLLFA